MKNNLLILSIICFLFAACGQKKPVPGPEATPTPKPGPAAGIYQTPSAHQITFEEAYHLISCFLGKENLRDGLGNKYAIGGTISLSGLKSIREKSNIALQEKAIENFNAEDLDVLNFYPCYDKIALLPNKVFLCYTSFTLRNDSLCGCGFRASYPIFKFDGTFPYKSGDVGEDDVKLFLEQQSEKIDYEMETVKQADVEKWADDFKKTFKVSSLADAPVLNTDRCGYFEKSDWDLLKNQYQHTPYEPVAIRYFFGYDGTKIRNKIRLIMIAVYADSLDHTKGWNLVKTPAGMNVPPLMIEKAWPPDNCKNQ